MWSMTRLTTNVSRNHPKNFGRHNSSLWALNLWGRWPTDAPPLLINNIETCVYRCRLAKFIPRHETMNSIDRKMYKDINSWFSCVLHSDFRSKTDHGHRQIACTCYIRVKDRREHVRNCDLYYSSYKNRRLVVSALLPTDSTSDRQIAWLLLFFNDPILNLTALTHCSRLRNTGIPFNPIGGTRSLLSPSIVI